MYYVNDTHNLHVLAIWVARSTNLLEYPHSLSYQAINLWKFLLSPTPALASKMDDLYCIWLIPGIMHEVLWDNTVLSVSEDTIEFSLWCLLDGGTDFLIWGLLGQFDSEVNNWDIDGWDSEGHSGEFALQFWEDQSYGLGSSSGGGDDVGWGSSTSSPILSTLGGAIDDQLIGSGCMDSGHKA